MLGRPVRFYLFIAQGILIVLAIRLTGTAPARWAWGLAALLAFWGALSAFSRRQTVKGTPLSRIATAAQGFVELRGVGRTPEGDPLVSPLTGMRCLWYRYEVERRGGRNDWNRVDSGLSDAGFVLDDGSDCCLVDPEGADITTRHYQAWSEGDMRYREWRLHTGDALCVLGEFRTLRREEGLDADADTRDLLAQWKSDQPALLKKFDLDHDGVLDAREWEMAQRLARGLVEKRHRELRAGPELHQVKSGQDSLYLISNEDPERLARRYLLVGLAELCVFFACLALAAGWSGPTWLPDHGMTKASIRATYP